MVFSTARSELEPCLCRGLGAGAGCGVLVVIVCYCCMTAGGWDDETEVLMNVSSRRLAPVQHRHLPARGLLSVPSLLRAFFTNRNRA